MNMGQSLKSASSGTRSGRCAAVVISRSTACPPAGLRHCTPQGRRVRGRAGGRLTRHRPVRARDVVSRLPAGGYTTGDGGGRYSTALPQ